MFWEEVRACDFKSAEVFSSILSKMENVASVPVWNDLLVVIKERELSEIVAPLEEVLENPWRSIVGVQYCEAAQFLENTNRPH